MSARIGPAIFLAVNPRNRREIAATIEALINLLDDLDGDPDLESTGEDEPSDGGIGDADGLDEQLDRRRRFAV